MVTPFVFSSLFLLEEKDTCVIMALEEKSLKDFLEKEPVLYSLRDIKVKVKCN
jgi:hypothetical protein